MLAKNITTTLLVITVVAVLIVLAFHVRIGTTADSIAVLKTTGMTCSSCSNKITKALEALQGVAVTEVDVAGGWVVVGYDTKAVKPEALAAKVRVAGFDSNVHVILTPEQFKQITGRDITVNAATGSGCCGGKGGCNSNKQI
jgi:copper chaperone CopZ